MQGAANASLESRVRKCGLLKERNLCLLAYSKRFVWSLGYLINQLLVSRKEGSTYFASVVGRCLTSHFLDLPTM